MTTKTRLLLLVMAENLLGYSSAMTMTAMMVRVAMLADRDSENDDDAADAGDGDGPKRHRCSQQSHRWHGALSNLFPLHGSQHRRPVCT